MQRALKGAMMSRNETVVVTKIMKSLEKFRQKGKENRRNVDKLKENILKRKSKVVESVVQSEKQKK